MYMRLEQLEYLLSLQETGSISRTAERYIISHQAVSKGRCPVLQFVGQVAKLPLRKLQKTDAARKSVQLFLPPLG